jgi:hypothetical protein
VRRLLRLVLVAFALTATAASAFLALLWIHVIITPSLAHQAGIAFLIGLEISYALALPILLIGTPCCGAALCRARRKRTNAPIAARGMLLCLCTLLAMGGAELVVALRHPRPHSAQVTAHSEKTVAGQFAEEEELPKQFAEPTKGDEIVLAVVGESSAFGMPFEKRMSVGKIVAWQLAKAIPGRSFDVEMVAEPGDTMRGQYARLARVSRRPHAIIVYCGHNEFATGTPWWQRVDPYYIDQRPSLLGQADLLAGRFSPVCRLIRETADRFRAGLAPPLNRRPPLVDAPAFSRAEYTARQTDFHRRLDAIVSYSERIGAIPILVIPPANDAEFDPSRSVLPPQTGRLEREEFTRKFLVAQSMEKTSPDRAIELYRALVASQPGFAETHYRLGRLLENAGVWDEAYQQFVMARDLDGFPMRCLTSFQDDFREVAARHHCIIVDGQALFHAIGPHGLLDDHLFLDAMHPTLAGHVALAQAILDALFARRAFGWPSEKNLPRINVAACADHFGLQVEDWRRVAEGGYMFYHATASLRYDPSQRKDKMRAFAAAAKRLAEGESPESVGLPNVGMP